MTESELKHLEELCSKATPGPWTKHENEVYHLVGDHELDGQIAICETYESGKITEMPNAEFIAAARTAVPELIAELRRLEVSWNDTTAIVFSGTVDRDLQRIFEQDRKTIAAMESKLASSEAKLQVAKDALDAIDHELGVPQPGYPATVANASDIARHALVLLKENE